MAFFIIIGTALILSLLFNYKYERHKKFAFLVAIITFITVHTVGSIQIGYLDPLFLVSLPLVFAISIGIYYGVWFLLNLLKK